MTFQQDGHLKLRGKLKFYLHLQKTYGNKLGKTLTVKDSYLKTHIIFLSRDQREVY